MKFSRRQWHFVLAATPLACSPTESAPSGEIIVSAQGDEESRFALTGVTLDGRVAADLRWGFRGHGMAAHPTRRGAVLFVARRPGTDLVLADIKTASVMARVRADPGTHFFGHGCFSRDGRLYTTEADIDAGVGLIGVRDADTLALIEHLPSHGVGPHELILMPDGDTLAVANGGIRTRPETGREKLNLDLMESRLSFVDRHSGDLLAEYAVDAKKASLRHLAATADGSVVVGAQLQREAMESTDVVALGYVLRPGEPTLQPLEAHGAEWRRFDDYVGSVACARRTGTAALTSPRGDRVGFWDVRTGAWRAGLDMSDVSGVTPVSNEGYFALSNSFGEVRFVDAQRLEEDVTRRVRHPELQWDNHLATTVIT